MTGVIIAGGAGTRLRPLTNSRPKPMMPLAGKPLLQYQVELLRKHAVTDVVFCVGGDVDAVRQHFGAGERYGVRVAYSVESSPLGTAGAVRFAEPYLQSDTLVVMNGDSLIDYDLSAMVRFHSDMKADATIGLMEVPRPTPCGVVTTDAEKRVTAFHEPDLEAKRMLAADRPAEAGTATVNSGVYVIARARLVIIPFGVESSIEKQFFPSIISDGRRVYGFPVSGYWADIGNAGNYLQAHHDLLAGKVDAEILGERTAAGYWTTGECEVAASAEVLPGAHLGAGSKVGPGARITGFAAIGPGCVIGDGSLVDGCVLLENVVVGSGCVLRNSVVDRDSTIGDGVQLADNSVVAAGSVVLAQDAIEDRI
jgi:NDP-sugar pyrophosphorylase family protein